MALSEFDRKLLERCLAREPRSWENFVDRFLGLVLHVVNHTSQVRSMRLSDQDREDLVAEVFLAIVRDDFAALKHFRGKSSLATYLTVVARRVVVRELMKRNSLAEMAPLAQPTSSTEGCEQRISDAEEVERLMAGLQEHEARVVQMYHLEGMSYSDISEQVGMPENSIGPTLSRARSKMRQRANLTQ